MVRNRLAFGKTRTLTKEKYGVYRILKVGSIDKDEILRISASLDEKNIILSDDLKSKIKELAEGGKTIIYLIVENRLDIRSESKKAIEALHNMGSERDKY